MSDKSWASLLEADRLIRTLSPNRGMGTGPQIRVTLIRGFELFNTRPYHNYETWSDGYVVEAFGLEGQVIAEVRREDLDDALEALRDALSQVSTSTCSTRLKSGDSGGSSGVGRSA